MSRHLWKPPEPQYKTEMVRVPRWNASWQMFAEWPVRLIYELVSGNESVSSAMPKLVAALDNDPLLKEVLIETFSVFTPNTGHNLGIGYYEKCLDAFLNACELSLSDLTDSDSESEESIKSPPSVYGSYSHLLARTIFIAPLRPFSREVGVRLCRIVKTIVETVVLTLEQKELSICARALSKVQEVYYGPLKGSDQLFYDHIWQLLKAKAKALPS